MIRKIFELDPPVFPPLVIKSLFTIRMYDDVNGGCALPYLFRMAAAAFGLRFSSFGV